MVLLEIPDTPARVMPSITVAAGCTFACTLVGVDDACESVQIAFGLSGDATATRVTAKACPGGEWHIDAPASCFPVACTAHYHVVGTFDGATRYLGGGTLRVRAAIPPQPLTTT